MNETRIHYVHMFMYLSNSVGRPLKTLGALEIDVIGPSHGILWMSIIWEVMENYLGCIAGRHFKR